MRRALFLGIRPPCASCARHIEDEQLQPGDLLFQGEFGGILAGSVIQRAWRNAGEAVLPPPTHTHA